MSKPIFTLHTLDPDEDVPAGDCTHVIRRAGWDIAFANSAESAILIANALEAQDKLKVEEAKPTLPVKCLWCSRDTIITGKGSRCEHCHKMLLVAYY